MSLNLPTLAEVAASRAGKPVPKGTPRAVEKGRKDRTERRVKKSVRQQCVARDGYCRLGNSIWGLLDQRDRFIGNGFAFSCSSDNVKRSEWAHFGDKRRARTRGQTPEARHTTAGTLMLCQAHHEQYDGKAKPRLFITALSRKGCDGPLKFRVGSR